MTKHEFKKERNKLNLLMERVGKGHAEKGHTCRVEKNRGYSFNLSDGFPKARRHVWANGLALPPRCLHSHPVTCEYVMLRGQMNFAG